MSNRAGSCRHTCTVPAGLPCSFTTAPPCRRSSDRTTWPSSAAKSAWLAVAAGGISAQHKKATLRERLQVPRRQVTQPPSDPVTDDRRTDRAAHREADPRRFRDAVPHQQMADEQRPPGPAASLDRSLNSVRRRIRAPDGSIGHHRRGGRQRRSDADSRTALTAACTRACAPGTGAHAQPETVRLRPTPIVRLERALAHRKLQIRVKVLGQPPSRGYRHKTRLACVAACRRPARAAKPARRVGRSQAALHRRLTRQPAEEARRARQCEPNRAGPRQEARAAARHSASRTGSAAVDAGKRHDVRTSEDAPAGDCCAR